MSEKMLKPSPKMITIKKESNLKKLSKWSWDVVISRLLGAAAILVLLVSWFIAGWIIATLIVIVGGISIGLKYLLSGETGIGNLLTGRKKGGEIIRVEPEDIV